METIIKQKRLLKKNIEKKFHYIRKQSYDGNYSGLNIYVIEKEELFKIIDEILTTENHGKIRNT